MQPAKIGGLPFERQLAHHLIHHSTPEECTHRYAERLWPVLVTCRLAIEHELDLPKLLAILENQWQDVVSKMDVRNPDCNPVVEEVKR